MATTTLNISLPDKMRDFVEKKTESEGYTISEYVRELIRRDQREDQNKLELLERAEAIEAVRAGLESVKSGRTMPLEKFDQEMRKKIRKSVK